MANIQFLDVSGNNITSIEALKSLGSLEKLTAINLSGNPICNTIGYPAQLFTSFTSVDSIDGLTREIFFGSERAKRPELEADSSSSSRGRASTSTGNSSADVIDEDKKTIKFLKDRLSSMEKAFELQESAVSAGAGKGQDESFPYLQLLQLWRKKALESMTSSASAKSEILRLEGDLKSLRTEHGAKVREHQLHALSYKERLKAAEQKAMQTESQLSAKSMEVEALRKEVQTAYDSSAKDTRVRTDLRRYLESAVKQIDTQSVGALLAVDEADRKLQMMQARIDAASKRVAFASGLVAQKEVTLRNTIAVSDAELRLSTPSATAVRREAGEKMVDDGEAGAGGVTQTIVKIPDSSLRPEAEALLRAIFHRLDGQSEGKVQVADLLSVISGPSEAGDDGERAEESSLVAICRDAFTPAVWEVVVASLRRLPQRSDLTWGEMLLLLIPAPASANDATARADLTTDDFEGLHAAGVWGDAEWGVVPLDMGSGEEAAAHLEAIRSGKITRDSEVHRLTTERAFLLARIQSMARTLERRAEAAKSYFDGDLRRTKLREARHADAIKDLKSDSQGLTTRLQESEATHQEMKHLLEAEVSTLQEQVDALRVQHRTAASEELKQSELAVRTADVKINRLETEQNLLQKELSKRDIANKGLQRDLVRLQSSLSALTTENGRLDEELQRTDGQLDQVLRERKEEVAALQEELEGLRTRLEKARDGEEEDEEEDGDEDADMAEVLRQQMLKVKALSEKGTAGSGRKSEKEEEGADKEEENDGEGDENRGNRGSAPDSKQSDVYAAHLDKLLRLAEEAIGHS